MMHRLLELCLVALTLTGLYFVWQSGRQRSASRGEYERLVRLTGDLPVTDPQKIHVLALDTGESLHYAWRVYLPPQSQIRVWRLTGSSSSSQSDPEHLIARVRIREEPLGQLHIYECFAGSSSRVSFGNESLAKFLRGRWDKVVVEKLGENSTAVVGPGEQAVLLRLTIPKELMEEARREIDVESLSKKLPVLFEMRIAPQPPSP